MIDNLFQKSKPTFISIQGETFVIGEKKMKAIDGFIHDLQRVRLHFFIIVIMQLTLYSIGG